MCKMVNMTSVRIWTMQQVFNRSVVDAWGWSQSLVKLHLECGAQVRPTHLAKIQVYWRSSRVWITNLLKKLEFNNHGLLDFFSYSLGNQ